MTFHVIDVQLATLPDDRRPFGRTRIIPPVDDGPVDAEGLKLFMYRGRAHYHPSVLATEGLRLLENHRLGGGGDNLKMAIRYANRLYSDGRTARAGLYLPYPFDFAMFNNDADRIHAPWFSALAQGEALAFFARLYEMTGLARYRDIAASLFATFLRPPLRNEPWIVFVNRMGYLWFEEYAKHPATCVLNGHITALFGLYNYYLITRSGDALKLIKGGLATVLHYFPIFRVPGEISYYSLRVPYQSAHYHPHVVAQMRMLAAITQDATFSHFADELTADYPGPPKELPPRSFHQKGIAGRAVVYTRTTSVAKSRSDRIEQALPAPASQSPGRDAPDNHAGCDIPDHARPRTDNRPRTNS
jgi:hypothetical protein